MSLGHLMVEVISPQLLKILTDLTGETKLDSALRIIAKEAIQHRLEHIAECVQTLEQKYGTSFEQFEVRFQRGEIPQQHSYEIEQDYLQWEGLVCRQRRLREAEDTSVDRQGSLSTHHRYLCSVSYCDQDRAFAIRRTCPQASRPSGSSYLC